MIRTSVTTDVHGYAEEGWGAVADAFVANYERGDEVGSACSVCADGRPVVDVWGGIADARTSRPWDRETVVVVFSTTKGASAICAHMLAERGELDLDAPVAKYWPEFAMEGKSEVRVRWLLSHQAGLPAVEVPLTIEAVCAWEPVIRALEIQRPYWTPGTQHLYHSMTYGFLIGEVVRRVCGRTLGQFFSDEVAKPLALDAWIGLPESVEHRVAHLEAPPARDDEKTLDDVLMQLSQAVTVPPAARELLRKTLLDPNSLSARAGALGGAFPELVSEHGGHNTRAVRAAELPASNMVTDARSLARMYAATVSDVEGTRLLKPETVNAMTAAQTSASVPYGVPLEMHDFTRSIEAPFSTGFMLPTKLNPWLGRTSFGHNGAGGSIGLAEPKTGVAFGYVMNRMAPTGTDQRARRLMAAVAECAR